MKEPDKITRLLTGISRVWRPQLKTREGTQLRTVLAQIAGSHPLGIMHMTDVEIEARLRELLGEA